MAEGRDRLLSDAPVPRFIRGWLLPVVWGTLPVLFWFIDEDRSAPVGLPLVLGGVVFAGAFHVVRRHPGASTGDRQFVDEGERR